MGTLFNTRMSWLVAILLGAATTAHAGLPPKLLAGDGALNDQFGYSVAIDVDTAMVGAYQDDDKGPQSGSVYVYERDAAGSWNYKQKLVPGIAAADDRFGISVSLSGNTAVVGAYGDNGFTGAAYVYERDAAGNWNYKQKLVASDAALIDFFGISVSISGNTAVVGANRNDDNGGNSGSAYVFAYDAPTDTWVEQQKLTASDAAADDQFGISVAIHSDTIVAGAYLDGDNGLGSGSAYVFKRTAGVWSEEDKLTASDGATDDWFGYSVSLHADIAIVGARQDDNQTGSAYVYKRSAGVWSEQAKLTASDGMQTDYFGSSVSVSGNTAIVGAFKDDIVIGVNIIDMGSAYVFARNAGGSWNEAAKLTASDTVQYDQFGFSVALSGDTALIGASMGDDDINNLLNTGSAYVFQDAFPLDPTEWVDTDDDGVGDNADTDDDNDGLLDVDEVNIHGTRPLLWDTDNDGFSDGYEVSSGADPLDDLSIPLPDGDVNGDNLVDLADLLLAMRILNGQYTPTTQEQARWDVAPLIGGMPSPDGFNTSGDYLVLQRKVLGIISF